MLPCVRITKHINTQSSPLRFSPAPELSKVRPRHSVNVLTFPGCDRSVGGKGTRLGLVYVSSHLAPSPVFDVCDDTSTPICAQAGLYMSREGPCNAGPSAAQYCLT